MGKILWEYWRDDKIILYESIRFTIIIVVTYKHKLECTHDTRENKNKIPTH